MNQRSANKALIIKTLGFVSSEKMDRSSESTIFASLRLFQIPSCSAISAEDMPLGLDSLALILQRVFRPLSVNIRPFISLLSPSTSYLAECALDA